MATYKYLQANIKLDAESLFLDKLPPLKIVKEQEQEQKQINEKKYKMKEYKPKN